MVERIAHAGVHIAFCGLQSVYVASGRRRKERWIVKQGDKGLWSYKLLMLLNNPPNWSRDARVRRGKLGAVFSFLFVIIFSGLYCIPLRFE